jgi:hypothetical protein
MFNEPLSPREVQAVQLLIMVTIGAFIGLRFVPSRFRQIVGLTLTIFYLAGIAAFVVYSLFR